jgi:hypothetical protein
MLTVFALSSAFAQAPTLFTTIQPASPSCDPAVVGMVNTSEPPCGESAVYLPFGWTSATPDTSLVVFLPGSSMVPADHAHVIKMAAQAGYPTIGLSYDSFKTLESICGSLPCSDDCHEKVRQERILGTDHTSSLSLTLPTGRPLIATWKDAVIPRLWEAIDAAAAADTAGLVDWELYYNPSKAHPRPRPADIHWENIILSGFSQGGGHGLYISQIEQVDGIVLFEGGNDVCDSPPVAASWYDQNGASAFEPIFAFGHRRGALPADVEIPLGLLEAGVSFVGDDLDTAGWTLTSGELAHTDQDWPSGSPGMKPCTEHTSMGRSDCMPTDATSGIEATVPSDAHLADPYVEAFELAGQ